MNVWDLVGQTIDEKYRIERELGRGGMGAVYLATHVGTERAVAVKVIAPEFMRKQEFIERFRREARAAGRLRHQNVVNVTDFGIAQTEAGNMAYLVMEYLDGCTLGEILEEEKKLPLSWTLDILEQTCAAVEEAHRQGIIHRDLKPDNIWLEPNANGGYTVKVLDFGIAKLDEPMHGEDAVLGFKFQDSSSQTNGQNLTVESLKSNIANNETLALNANNETLALPPENAENATLNLESQNPKSKIQNQDSVGTAIFNDVRATAIENAPSTEADASGENFETKILAAPTTAEKDSSEKDSSNETSALTRVGAVLGTPLYMSPEQCRGDKLDPRADVYSLGVIAYQMLSGTTPFSGKYTFVLKAHQELPAPRLEAKKVPRKVKKVIASAMAKNADERPATASAYASKLRSSSEGIGALLRRAMTLYSEHLPTFLGLTLLLMLPLLLMTVIGIVLRFLDAAGILPETVSDVAAALIGLGTFFTGIFFGSIAIGVTTWIVAQLLAVPLRPVNWRMALKAAKTKWRSFAGTVTTTSVLSFLGCFLGVIPGVIMLVVVSKSKFAAPLSIILNVVSVLLMIAGSLFALILFVYFHLVASVVMMENLRGRKALKRSMQLVSRARKTAAATVFLNFFLPLIIASLLGLMVTALVSPNELFTLNKDGGVNIRLKTDEEEASEREVAKTEKTEEKTEEKADENKSGNNPKTSEIGASAKAKKDSKSSLKLAIYESIYQIFWFPLLLLISSFTAVVTALLYLKTRQSGGESMSELLTQFEETDRTQKRWQLRLKNKLEQTGRNTSRHS